MKGLFFFTLLVIIACLVIAGNGAQPSVNGFGVTSMSTLDLSGFSRVPAQSSSLGMLFQITIGISLSSIALSAGGKILMTIPAC